jgi:hypothetical protein
LAKFGAIPNYTYLVMKMSTETGVLTVRSNLQTAYDHKKEAIAMAEATDVSILMKTCAVDTQKLSPEEQEIPEKTLPRAATKNKETKNVVLIPGDPSKITRIGTDLDPK